MKLVETADLYLTSNKQTAINKRKEEVTKEIPNVIYPEIRAITANKKTRNNTYYPKESLKAGIKSLTDPYPIPIIKDHASKNTLLPASEIFGRSKLGRFIEIGAGGFVSVIFEVTDKEAIDKIITSRFLTVSIGVEAHDVWCSICNKNIAQGEECDHSKGQAYLINGKEEICYWIIGDVTFQEVSFVTIPSDDEAKVISIRYELNESEETKEVKENLMLGELYELSESDEYFNIESTLNTKQRDALPDSDFCGQNRSFPAHDKIHTQVGLRLLGRYKGTGKEDIKKCLQRKLDNYSSNKENLITVINLETKESTELIEINSLNIKNILENIKKLELSEIIITDIQKELLKLSHSSENVAGKELLTYLEDEYPTSGDFIPVIIFASNEEYLKCVEIFMENKEVEDPKTELTESAKINLEEQELKISTLNENVESLKISLTESNRQAESFGSEIINLNVTLHKSLSEQTALLMKVLNKPQTKDKDISDLSKELYKRTTESLSDTLSDLYLEFKESLIKPVEDKVEIVDVSTIETSTNPVIQEDNNKQETLPVTEKKDENSLYKSLGIDPENIKKSLNR